METHVNMLAVFPHKKQVGIHATNSLHLTNPLLVTSGDVLEGNQLNSAQRTRFPNVLVFIQEFLELSVLSFQRNYIIILRKENVCVCVCARALRLGICLHMFTYIIRYSQLNIQVFLFP